MDELIGKTLPLKFGSSFQSNSSLQSGSEKYHTVRYDFKPPPMSKDVPGEVMIQSDREVTITLPVQQAPGAPGTLASMSEEGEVVSTREDIIYKGNKKPAQKECVLIIDHETGEVTLEKIESVMMVKKTRKEKTAAQIAALNRQLTQQSQPSLNGSATGGSDEPKVGSDNSNGVPEPMEVSLPADLPNPIEQSSVLASSDNVEEASKKSKKSKTKKELGAKKKGATHQSLQQDQFMAESPKSTASSYDPEAVFPYQPHQTVNSYAPPPGAFSPLPSMEAQHTSNTNLTTGFTPSTAPESSNTILSSDAVEKKTRNDSSKSNKKSKQYNRVSTLSSSGSDSDSSGSSSGSDSDSSSGDENDEKNMNKQSVTSSNINQMANKPTDQQQAIPTAGRNAFDLRDDLQLSDSD